MPCGRELLMHNLAINNREFHWFLSRCFLIALAVLSAACNSGVSESLLVLRGATLIDGTGSSPIKNSAVLVDGERIVAAGHVDRVPIPKGTREIDLAGKWIIPGMTEVHMHLFESGRLYTRPDLYDLQSVVPHAEERDWIRNRMRYTLSRFLCAGITTAAALSGPGWTLGTRDEAVNWDLAPRLAIAGPTLQISPVGESALWTNEEPAGLQVEGPEAARLLVRRSAAGGFDLVKSHYLESPEYSLDDYVPVLEAIVDESHLHGLPVAVHVGDLLGAKAAVRAGADVLAHTVYTEPIDDELIQLARDSVVITVSDLDPFSALARMLTQDVELLEVERTCGDPEVIASWRELNSIPENERPELPGWLRQAPAIEQTMLENIKRMHDGGVKVAVGSDAGFPGILHGAAFHRELLLMEQAGIPPMDIIVAATQNGARALSRVGADPDWGMIAPDKLADLVILDADPLVRIANVAEIHAVVKGGQMIDREILVQKARHNPSGSGQ